MLSFESEEESDGENDVIPSKKPDTSGRWSTLSWSSLYERASESSLSWADDELERDATDKVRSIFKKIECEIYEEEKSDPLSDDLSKDLINECKLWRDKFPHLRAVGNSIPKPGNFQPHDQHEEPEDTKYFLHPTMTAQKTRSERPAKLLTHKLPVASSESAALSLDEENEEVFATDGAIHALDLSQGMTFPNGTTDLDLILNDKFESDPKKYLEDKLMEGLFKKMWSKVSDDIQRIVDKFSLHLIEQNKANDDDNFWSYESLIIPEYECSRLSGYMQEDLDSKYEDSILSSLNGSKPPFTARPALASSPVSDLNPISLPNLRPAPTSAPVVRNIPSHSPRLLKSTQERTKVVNSFKPITVLSNQGLLLPNNKEKCFIRNLSIDEETVIRNPGVKPRSKSGSPPLRPPSSSRPHPISLPPIQLNGRILPIGFPPMTLPRIGSSALSTPRSMKYESGKASPSSRTMTSDISISGIRLKKLNPDQKSDNSKLDAKITARPKFRI